VGKESRHCVQQNGKLSPNVSIIDLASLLGLGNRDKFFLTQSE
jgi:hypothetical protein